VNYTFSYANAHRHFIDIELKISACYDSNIILKLPSWRPGRYELGDFARNIQYFKVFDNEGNTLKFTKVNKDTWDISTPNMSDVIVKYNYYANELNAGSTYLDERQLYVNPINCCLYAPKRMEEEHSVELIIPSNYKIACALQKNGNILNANSFDELAESPWIASPTLVYNTYNIKDYKFYIWFQGECQPDWNRIIKDFKAFTTQQIKDFGDFPVKEYHFINQILPYKAYHGVEHTSSTVISLGPGNNLMGEEMYKSFLGVSSHELYHTWNIKQIRPIEMLPYDYSKENYSTLGFLYEGVTTYMGDLYLMRSRVFDQSSFFKTQEQNLNKHFHNGGRLNMSVADSSFDTWLDGYVLGVPNRKVSIYTEGALCAFMLDVQILKNSGGVHSLRSLMAKLYTEYAKKGKGISKEDLLHELMVFGGNEALLILEDHIYGCKDFKPTLDNTYSDLGIEIQCHDNKNFLASSIGVKGVFNSRGFLVKTIAHDSLAEKNKISEGDELIMINDKKPTQEFLDTIKSTDTLKLVLRRRFDVLDIEIVLGAKHYCEYKINVVDDSIYRDFCFGK